MPDGFPREKVDLLKNILSTNWNIFNLEPNYIYRFLINLLSEKYAAQPELFDRPVGIFEMIDDDYLQQYSILGKYQWKDFVKEIKEKNRFHTDIVNKEILSKLLQFSFKKYKELLFIELEYVRMRLDSKRMKWDRHRRIKHQAEELILKE